MTMSMGGSREQRVFKAWCNDRALGGYGRDSIFIVLITNNAIRN